MPMLFLYGIKRDKGEEETSDCRSLPMVDPTTKGIEETSSDSRRGTQEVYGEKSF